MKIRVVGDPPKYAHEGDSGVDLISTETENLWPGETYVFRTGLYVEIPDGYELQIRSRSGLAMRGIVVANSPGTIDSGYRGEIGVILHNLNQDGRPHKVCAGDRIAQAVLSKVEKIEWEVIDTLQETDRGEKGFGSTGI